MSYLLEAVGRGLVGDLFGAMGQLLPAPDSSSLETLAERVRRDKHDLLSQERLACALMEEAGQEDLLMARALFERLVNDEAHRVSGHLGLACIADRLGQNDLAEGHLCQALQVRREDPILMFSLAMTYEKLDRPSDAQRLYEDTLRLCPALRNARERLTALRILDGDLAAAARHYRLLTAARPEQLGARLVYANLLLAAGDAISALSAFEEALTLEADNWESECDQASQLENEGRFEEAAESLENVLGEDPGNADLHVRLGDLYVKTGNDRRALDVLVRAVELQPDYLEANVKVGTHYLRLGRYREAALWFARAVDINDRLLVGYAGLAVAQHETGDRAGAEETLDMAASIEPNSTLLFSEAARLELKSSIVDHDGRYAEAAPAAEFGTVAQQALKTGSISDVLDLLDTLIERVGLAAQDHPNHAQLHYQQALLLRNRGRVQEANDSLVKAVSINPSYTKALIKLGLGLRETGCCDDAMDYFKQALRYHRKTVALHYKLALMFSQQPRFDITQRSFESALAGKADRIDAAANLQLALENMSLVSPSTIMVVDPDEYGPRSLRCSRRFWRKL
jgi:tetratricopeptide (TPR) repeat protein